MRLQEIVGIVIGNFTFALVALVFLGVIFFMGYFVIYKKLFKGKKSLSKRQLLTGGLLIGYLIMVVGVTLLNRGGSYHGGMSLALFSTYKEAWHSYSVRYWQFVILNIVMFIPLGILLPMLHPLFQKAAWTIGAAFLLTLSIESIQLITGYGNFIVDDLFNNLLGAIIGYGIIMAFISLKAKAYKQSLLNLSPLLLVIIIFTSIFTYYQMKEFGNLPFASTQSVSMKEVTTRIDVELNNNRVTVPIYKAPSLTKDEAKVFIHQLFNNLNLDTTNMEIISYQNEGIYQIRSERSHSIWLNYLDGNYRYTDFSHFDDGIELIDATEEALVEKLGQFGIQLPREAAFHIVDTGIYEWTLDNRVLEDKLIDGFLRVSYYNDESLKEINNSLITYEKVRDVEIKSEKEAYEEVLAGKFRYYSNNIIRSLHIHNVELRYYLDTKGYYQPIYAFQSTVDGMEYTILIPGI